MKVALFGSTGFVGKYILRALQRSNHEIYTLIRKQSEFKVNDFESLNIINGEITNNTSLEQTMMNCSTVIYNIGIIREFPSKNIRYKKLHFEYAKRIIDKAKTLKVKHFILMSANGVKPEGTEYQTTKYEAEQYLINSGLNYTIFRPSLIFGEPKNDQEFCTQLRDTMIKLPFPAPLFFKGFQFFNAGRFKMSPIHVENVAEFFNNSIEKEEHYSQTYHLGGPQSYNWEEIISTISNALRRNKWMIPAPVIVVKMIALLFDRFSFFPITRDQLTMLLEGNTCDSNDLFKKFEIIPTEFSSKNLSYLRKK